MVPDPVTVFVPAHVTGFFAVYRKSEARTTGSTGAGVTLTDGVTVTVSAGERSLVLDGSAVEIPAVDSVLGELAVDAQVEASSDVPLGSGFGVSGAVALGTAFAANRYFGCERSEEELAMLAHVGDIEANTGLGDVVSQLHGGAPIRYRAGGPGIGRIDGIPDRRRIEYLTLGDLDTREVLAGDTSAITAAGESALDELRETPTLEQFWRISKRFARESGLLTSELHSIIDAVETAGGQATMGMLGETVIALETGLTDAGYDAVTTRIANGPRFVDDDRI